MFELIALPCFGIWSLSKGTLARITGSEDRKPILTFIGIAGLAAAGWLGIWFLSDLIALLRSGHFSLGALNASGWIVAPASCIFTILYLLIVLLAEPAWRKAGTDAISIRTQRSYLPMLFVGMVLQFGVPFALGALAQTTFESVSPMPQIDAASETRDLREVSRDLTERGTDWRANRRLWTNGAALLSSIAFATLYWPSWSRKSRLGIPPGCCMYCGTSEPAKEGVCVVCQCRRD